MKKRVVKISAIIALIALMLTNTTVAFARDFHVSNNGMGFEYDWMRYAAFNNGTCEMQYGFNTFAVDEDFCYAGMKYSQAYLTNGSGTHRGKAALYSNWSTIEWQHSGSYIVYGVTY